MIVSYYGEGFFRLQSGDTVLVVDPTNNRQKADVVLRSEVQADLARPPEGEIAFPGEYEVRGIEIRGFPARGGTQTVRSLFFVAWEDIRFLFLGHSSEPPDPNVLEEIRETDVLVLPVGSGFFAPEDAAKLVRQLEPSIVVPSFSKNAAAFAKALGQSATSEEKIVFKKKDLAPKQCKLVILASKGE